MDGRNRFFALLAVSTLLIASITTSGCSAGSAGDGATDSIAPGGAVQPMPEYPAMEEQASRDMAVAGAVVDGAKIVKNGDVTLWVDDVTAAAEQVADVAKRHDGVVVDSRLGDGGGYPIPYASGRDDAVDNGWVTLKVPADSLEAAIADIKLIGDVRSSGVSAADVTTQHVDMTARLDNLKASESRMRELLAQTESVADAIAVESELSRLRSEIDSLEGQLRYLDDQIDMSSITVSIMKTPSPASAFDDFNLAEMLARALRGALTVIQWVLTFVIALIPVILVLWIVIAIVRAIRRRKVG